MAFDMPPPDLTKLIAAWEQWETGEESPGKVLALMKTAGLPADPEAARRVWVDPGHRLSRRSR